MIKQEQKTEWAYLCTFAVPFLGYGTGTMLGADASINMAIPILKDELKKLGWDVRAVEYEQDGHYFNDKGDLRTPNTWPNKSDVFYNTYEAKMRGIKSRDIPRRALEKIAIKEGLRLIDCT